MAEHQPLVMHRDSMRRFNLSLPLAIQVTRLLALILSGMSVVFNHRLLFVSCICVFALHLTIFILKYLLSKGNITVVVVLFNIGFNILTVILVLLSPLSLAVTPLYPIILFAISTLYSGRRLMVVLTGIALLISMLALSLWLGRYIYQPFLLNCVVVIAVFCTQILVIAVVWQVRKQYVRLFNSAQQAQQLLQQAHDQLEQTVAQRTKELSDLVVVQRATLESTADGIFVTDAAHHVIAWNQKLLDLWHIPHAVITTHDKQPLLDCIRRQLVEPSTLDTYVGTEDSRPTHDDREVLHLQDGRVFSCYRQIKQINSTNQACVLSFRDITHGVRAAHRGRALAALSQKLSVAVSVADAARIITSVADDLLHCDACFFNMYDQAADAMWTIIEFDQIDGRRVEQFCSDLPRTPSEIAQRTMREGGQLLARTSPESALLDSFGDIDRESESLLYVPVRHGSTVVGVLSIQSYTIGAYNQADLELLQALADQCGGALERIHTEAALRRAEDDRLALERKMLESQKLESLGILAGGIAHDFNNLLAVIFGNVTLAQLDLEPDHSAALSIQQVDLAARRAADLTHQMLAYAGKSSISAQPIALNLLISEMDGLLRASLPKHIQITQQFAADLPELQGDATQIRQIVMNLLVNAAEAIGEHMGSIVIRTGLINVSRSDLAGAAVGADIAEGRYLFVEIADSGCGMDEMTRSKIFDPFFSTKFTGRGLGLAAVLGIARSHHGAILLESAPSRGTTFRVLLPPALEPMLRGAPADSAVTDWVGSGHILVVDDEPSVQALVGRILERLGFTTTNAASGPEALAYFASDADSIAAVLLDLTMPQMSGQQVLQAMRLINPQVPIILMSGYTEEDARRVLDTGDAAGFLHKPFRLTELSDLLRCTLSNSDQQMASSANCQND